MNKKAKILVVDDEENIRKSLNEILIDEGYEVFLAKDANFARKIKEKEKIDLILLDIWMPDCDGISLLKEWEKNKQLLCPVIMMSGHGTIDTAIEATKIGAFDFLEKPISLQKLLKTIGSGLKRTIDIKRLSPEFFEKSQHSSVKAFKEKINILKKQDLFFIFGINNNFFKILIAYLYGNDFYLLDRQKEFNKNLLKLLQAKGKNFLIISNNETLKNFTEQDHRELLQSFVDNGIKILISDTNESLIRNIFFDDSVDMKNFIHLPVGNDIDLVPDYANAFLDYYIQINPNIGFKEFDISALNFIRSNNKFLNLDYLDDFIYKVVTSIEKELITRDDIEVIEATPESLPNRGETNSNFDKPLKDARDAFEKSYFEYHLARNKSVAELSKIADIERTHLYRKLKQLGIKNK
ncbi:MAG: response regulator [Methylophilaceae bacterium]